MQANCIYHYRGSCRRCTANNHNDISISFLYWRHIMWENWYRHIITRICRILSRRHTKWVSYSVCTSKSKTWNCLSNINCLGFKSDGSHVFYSNFWRNNTNFDWHYRLCRRLSMLQHRLVHFWHNSSSRAKLWHRKSSNSYRSNFLIDRIKLFIRYHSKWHISTNPISEQHDDHYHVEASKPVRTDHDSASRYQFRHKLTSINNSCHASRSRPWRLSSNNIHQCWYSKFGNHFRFAYENCNSWSTKWSFLNRDS